MAVAAGPDANLVAVNACAARKLRIDSSLYLAERADAVDRDDDRRGATPISQRCKGVVAAEMMRALRLC